MFNTVGYKFVINNGSLVLFWYSKFSEIISIRNKYINLVRFGCNDFSIKTFLRKDNLNTTAFINSKRWNFTLALDFNTITVNKFNYSNTVIENNTTFVTTINTNTVDFLSFNVKNTVIIFMLTRTSYIYVIYIYNPIL